MPLNKAGALEYLGHPLLGPLPDHQADISPSSEKAHAHPLSSEDAVPARPASSRKLRREIRTR